MSQPNLNSLEESSEPTSDASIVNGNVTPHSSSSSSSTSSSTSPPSSSKDQSHPLQGCRMKGQLNLIKRATSNPNLSETQMLILGRGQSTEERKKPRNPLIAQWEQKIQSSEQIK